jgi:hypothetical protein
MTFHRAWLLELEESLLAVVPGLKALPYVDITMDLKGGGCHGLNSLSVGECHAPSAACCMLVCQEERVCPDRNRPMLSRFPSLT